MLKKHTILTLFFFLLDLMANAQIVNIPDVNFKNALVNTKCVDTDGNGTGDIDADTNDDGEIQVSEALAVTSLYISNLLIQSLEGIEAFTQLKTLNCGYNKLKTLNVQGLINLQALYCSANQLTTLDVHGLANLKEVVCDNNKLTTLNLQGLINLQELYCSGNQLTILDARGLSNLQKLFCHTNQLMTLDVQGLSNLQEINCSINQLMTLNVQGLNRLRNLTCHINQLTTLDVRGLNNLLNLLCSRNQLTALDVQGITKLSMLQCNNNQLTELYIKNGSIETNVTFNDNPQLRYICCDEGQLSSVQSKASQYGLQDCYINTSCFQIGAHIKGNIKQDQNLDCQADATETGMAGRIIKAEKTGAESFYAITNGAGHYEIVVDTGFYKLSVPNALSSNYYALCEDNIEVNLPKTEDSIRADFLLTPVIFCPLLEVNIASSRMRRCFENQYIVRYCNVGPAPAPNAQVTVMLSKDVQFVSSSIPGVNIGGQRWSFPLGEVASEDCGSFSINFLVLCDSTVLGQSICASAHITPDSICTPANATWSGAEVVVDGYCEGDSVRFVIRNIGTGDMTEAKRFIIVEDIVIFRTGTFNLQAQDSLVFKVRANGSTYRLDAEQETTYPFPSMPSATVEGCGQNLSGLFSLGFVSQFNEIDGNPFYSRDCREVVGSYDPNDKSAQPSGVGSPHYIEPKTPIDYLIRFQNTGTDTAFTVVIRDTLSTWLDPESFRAGISDHDFTVDFEQGNILKFTFNNILLPDSNVNEAASHGFVRFRITPRSSTPLGTKIENRAAIFFDFNAPIITNWVFHTVDTGFLKRKNLSVFSGKTPMQQQVYPNPVRTGELLYFEDLPEGNSSISLIDPLGKTAFSAPITGNMLRLPSDLPHGMYFLEWTGEKGKKRWGKIWVRE